MKRCSSSLFLLPILLLAFGCVTDGGDEGTEDVTAAEEELFGGNCYGTDRYPEHGVYDTTLIYMIDETIPAPGEVFLPMDDDRNTLEYRQGAYDFFEERYGMVFDPNIAAPQIATDAAGGQALVQPTKTGEGDTSTHQVYGLDAQHIPQWRNRMPMTNVAFRDDGYFVFFLTDFMATGTYGAENGVAGSARIRAGDIATQGEYRMFDHRDRLLDTITYFGEHPATVNPFNGDEASSHGATYVNINCRVESALFGTGATRAIGEIRPNADGSTTLDFRYVMRFPSVLDEPGAGWDDRCRNIRPLRGH